MWELWPVILAGAIVVYMLLRYRETFVLKYGNPFDNEDLISFNPDAKGTRLFSTTPDTCPLDRPEYDAGLCYEQCDQGYNGVGPVCWADTKTRGIGVFPRLTECDEMGLNYDYKDAGLSCIKMPSCEVPSGFAFFNPSKWKCSGPDLKFKKLVCNKMGGYRKFYTQKAEGFCYKKCPKDKPGYVPGMPYLCTAAQRGLSYGRGVGTVPPLFRFGA